MRLMSRKCYLISGNAVCNDQEAESHQCPDICLFWVTLQRSTNAAAVLHAVDLKDAYTCSHSLQNSHWYDILHVAKTACPARFPTVVPTRWQGPCHLLSCLCTLVCSCAWPGNVGICFLTEFTGAGQPIVYPRNDLSYTENILHMMFSLPSERYQVDPVLSKALEIILILHMDHEQNASTSTVRVAGKNVTMYYMTMSMFVRMAGEPFYMSAQTLSCCQQWQELGWVAVFVLQQ